MRVIRASEIGEYLYCRRAWWLRQVCEVESQNVRELHYGTTAHTRHGFRVSLARWLQRAALVAFGLAILGGLLLWLLN